MLVPLYMLNLQEGAAWPLTDTAGCLLQKRRVLLTMLGEGDGRRSPEQLSKTANWWTDP